MKKLGIIVPYRNRKKQLREFSRNIKFYLDNLNIPYHVFVIHQDDAKQFNRGSLLNIGFKYAEKNRCDYVVFHDIDMIPLSVDYSYSETPLHLATNFTTVDENEKPKETFDEYFGGVTMFTMEDFKKIDGYSNKYWGWGYEDTDLLYRCKKHNLNLDEIKIKNLKNKCTSLKFNGVDAYVKGEKTFDMDNNITFFISFYPEKFICNHLDTVDNFNVFTIPGYDFAISFNSFSRYNFCTFDKNLNVLYVNSKIKVNYKTNMCVVVNHNDKIICVYQDGIKIGEVAFNDIYDYSKEKYFYLGSAVPDRELMRNITGPKYFKGTIDFFAVWDTVLNEDEINEISTNFESNLSRDFGKYKSSYSLKVHYDAEHIKNYKLVDLSGNENYGEIVNCEIVKSNYNEYVKLKIPFRRNSLFRLLPHTENGFYNNKWKTQATRWNQLRFHNEVTNNNELIKNDGLSTLEFIEHGVNIINENFTHINIGI
jgi:hypothetical protein